MLGADDKKVMFLFTDAHVADEGFLELINNMLTSGMVPALYDDNEKDSLVNRCESASPMSASVWCLLPTLHNKGKR